MPRMQRSAPGRWQVFWQSSQMQVARGTQTGDLRQILPIMQKGHEVCTAGMLASPCLHASSQSWGLTEMAAIFFLCAGVEITRRPSALGRCSSSVAGKGRIYLCLYLFQTHILGMESASTVPHYYLYHPLLSSPLRNAAVAGDAIVS